MILHRPTAGGERAINGSSGVLPDFQGMGIGSRLLDTAAALEVETGHRVSICTRHPALITSLARSPRWRCSRITRRGRAQTNVARNATFRNTGTRMASFAYVTG